MIGDAGQAGGGAEILLLERTIKASPERVFAAWTDPALLPRWWGPPGTTVEVMELDCRVGGRYRIGIRYPPRATFYVSGTYEAIQPPHRLVFTWRWEDPDMDIGQSLVTVELQARGEHTELRLTHARLPTAEARQAHREGWLGILDKLVLFLTGGDPFSDSPAPGQAGDAAASPTG